LKRKNDKISAHMLSCVSIPLLLQNTFPLPHPKTLNNTTKKHHNKNSFKTYKTQKMVATKLPQVPSQPPSQLSSQLGLLQVWKLPQKRQARGKNRQKNAICSFIHPLVDGADGAASSIWIDGGPGRLRPLSYQAWYQAMCLHYMHQGFDQTWGVRNVLCRRNNLSIVWNWKRQRS
jgi:hypothetical protein